MSDPAVSVLMAAYNGATLIEETLASLAAQSFGDFEVLVVDDCSTDDTRDVVRRWRDPRVRLIEASVNGGPVRARNIAFAAARGRYCAGLDQDDLCHPDRFSRQVAFLDAEPAIALVATAARVLEDGTHHVSQLPAHTTPALVDWLLHVSNPLVWSSVMIRASAARELSVFGRSDVMFAEDFDLYHRLRHHGGIARIDDELTIYRAHAGGASQRHTARMVASARTVLLDVYQTILGDGAEAAATLIARHVLGNDPVPDRVTLSSLASALLDLQEAYIARHRPAREDYRLIRYQTARLWWRVCRRAVRSGTLPISDVLRLRPDHLGLGHASLDDIVMTGLVGSARRFSAGAR